MFTQEAMTTGDAVVKPRAGKPGLSELVLFPQAILVSIFVFAPLFVLVALAVGSEALASILCLPLCIYAGHRFGRSARYQLKGPFWVFYAAAVHREGPWRVHRVRERLEFTYATVFWIVFVGGTVFWQWMFGDADAVRHSMVTMDGLALAFLGMGSNALCSRDGLANKIRSKTKRVPSPYRIVILGIFTFAVSAFAGLVLALVRRAVQM